MSKRIEMPTGLPRPVVLVSHRGPVTLGPSAEGPNAYLVADRVRDQP